MKVNIAKVFVNEKREFGNPVGIVVDEEHKLGDEERQKIATKLNFSETVFIDSLGTTPEVNIFNPKHKVKFAGHAVLGAVYFINHVLGKKIDSIKCWGKDVAVRFGGEITSVVAPLAIMPNWNFKKFTSSAAVKNLGNDVFSKMEHTFVWAWIDEPKGLVRARTFAPDWGILEDQANGSGSMMLASKLNRNLKIRHGDGSLIFARPVDKNFGEVGGMVSLVPEMVK